MTEHKFTYLNHKGDRRLRTVQPLALEYLMSPGFGYQPGYFLRALDLEKQEQRSFAVDPLRMFPEAGFLRIEIDDLSPIKDTVQNLQNVAVSNIETRRSAIADFAMWLTTRPTPLTVGASHEVPDMIAVMEEYFKLKGYGNGRLTVADRVGDQDNTQDR